MFDTDTYQCDIVPTKEKTKYTGTTKNKVSQAFASSVVPPTGVVQSCSQKSSTVRVPVSIISPVTNIIWMYLCENWRINLDFNFSRPNNWSGDSRCTKFNHTEYVQKHFLYDWHDYAVLPNGSWLHQGVVVDIGDHPEPRSFYYIDRITYDLPGTVVNATRASDFPSAGNPNKQFWLPNCHMHSRRILQRGTEWLLDSQPHKPLIVDRNVNWHVVPLNTFRNRTFRHSPANNTYVPYELPPPQYQDPDVAQNKPFWFFILGFDKYQHTRFTGKHDMQTHGCYWWMANFNADLQFTKQLSMISCQAPAIVPMDTVVSLQYRHWQYIMEKGCLIWNGHALQPVRGMVSHHLTDMQDRDHLLRRRGNNKASRMDGQLNYGHLDGCAWPDGVTNLLEIGCITPGPYLLKLWRYLHRDCCRKQPPFWTKPPAHAAIEMTLTMNEQDVLNGLALDSTTKAPLEINHTTLLGLLKMAFEIEWTFIHKNLKFNETDTRAYMNAFLDNCWNGVNGVRCFVRNPNCNILLFNQMHHSWQKMLEIMFSVCRVVDYTGHLSILNCLIRLTGCLHDCATENQCKRLQVIMKPILKAGTSHPNTPPELSE